MTVTYEFVNPSGNLTLDESNLISHNPVLTHTGKADLRATFEETRSLDDYAKRQDRLNVKLNGVTKWTGYIVGASHNEKQGTTTVRADGIAKRLEETRPDYESIGGPVSYSNTALHDAIRDYWDRTEFSNFTVTDQTTDIVATDEELQSASTNAEWGNITTIPDDVPILIQNGNLELAQSCYFSEGENPTTSTGSFFNSPDYSGCSPDDGSGGAEGFAPGEGGTWEFNIEYTIPADSVGAVFRQVNTGGGTPGGSWYLNGNELSTIESSTSIERDALGWDDLATDPTWGGDGYTGPDLTPANNPHTLEWDSDGTGAGELEIDAVALTDTRYSYNFDETVTTANDGCNYLDGPELYPNTVELVFNSITTSYNIDSADVNTTWDDTSNGQELAVSNDGGGSYTTAQNTSTLNVDFSTSGRVAQVRFTFDRYGSGNTSTPANGFNGQIVQEYTLTADLNDLVVIDSLELTRNHFDNLQQLHDYGNFLWVIEHDDSTLSNLVVSSFQEGDETRSSPSEWDNPENKNPEVKADQYFNSVYLEGAKDSNGDRPTAEVSDSDAISNDGREIQVFLRDLSITTEAGAGFRAQSLLQTALSNNDLVGSITAPPSALLHPGYSRQIDMGDGLEYKTVEELRLSQSNNELVETTDFTVREDFAEEISRLKRQARDIGNEV